MCKRVAKAIGKTASEVSPGEIAHAFLDLGCERKKKLRSGFVKVLDQAGVLHNLVARET